MGYIFVHAPEYTGITDAHFKLEPGLLNPDNVTSITLGTAVTIEAGELFQGITLSWSSLDLEHCPVLELTIDMSTELKSLQSSFGDFCISNAYLLSTSGDTIVVDDLCTLFGHFDCFDCFVGWHHPDTVDVVIGTSSSFNVIWWLSCTGLIGPNVLVSDEKGWTQDWNPQSVYGSCGACPWNMYKTMQITVEVPESTFDQTLSEMIIKPTSTVLLPDSTSLILRAIPRIGVQDKTWSGIKKLFQKN